jgi:hypothetical protein
LVGPLARRYSVTRDTDAELSLNIISHDYQVVNIIMRIATAAMVSEAQLPRGFRKF